VGACMGEEMDEDIDVHAEMVGVGLCTGAGVVSGAGTSVCQVSGVTPG